jgi:hypothetical protein
MPEDDAAWEWLKNSAVAENYQLTGYVMLGEMKFAKPADDFGFIFGNYYSGEEYGMAAVYSDELGIDTTVAYTRDLFPYGTFEYFDEVNFFAFEELRPAYGDWEDGSGGLDWNWGSSFDPSDSWFIWNYSSEGAEWANGAYETLIGQTGIDPYDGALRTYI